MVRRLPITKLICCFLTYVVLVSVHIKTEAGIVVLASIKPLALITQPLLGPDDQLSVLLPPVSSPHDYALKASDMARLQQADVVIWMGPLLERFLTKPLAIIDRDKQVLAYYARLEKSDTQDKGLSVDPHLWLDPHAVEDMTELIGQKLIELDRQHEADIRSRIDAQTERLRELSQTLQQRFAPVRERGFVVYHRAYDHLVEAFGLTQIGVITLTPEQPPGARHLMALQAQLKTVDGNCLFVEASHDSASVRTIARQLGLQLALLDPLGVNESVQNYADLMLRLADNMVACLSPASPQ